MHLNHTIENISEMEYAGKMADLNEKKLICWAIKVCFIPSLIISIIATFFPYPQAFVPVQESKTCICYFLSEGKSYYILLKAIDSNYTVLTVINVVIFFGLNWVFLLMNILNVYHVRHIRDRLEIRKEMTYIVLMWLIFCLL